LAKAGGIFFESSGTVNKMFGICSGYEICAKNLVCSSKKNKNKMKFE
jgi:hypothetical protein